MRSLNKLTIFFIALLFVYYETYRWIPLGAWNGEFRWPVTNDQFFPDIVIGLLLVWSGYVFWAGRRKGMWAT
jgi:hypothetical protein